MPFARNSELPSAVRGALPGEAQTIFRNVVNSQLESGLPENRAFASAWAALRNQGWEKNPDTGKWRKVRKRQRRTGQTNGHTHTFDDAEPDGVTSIDDGHNHTYLLGDAQTSEAEGHTHTMPADTVRKEWAARFKVAKVDEFERQVFGFASVIEKADGTPLVDLQGDIIPEEELERAVYEYVRESRDGSLMHEELGKATLIESFVVTKRKRDLLKLDLPLGWWVGYQVLDDDVFKRVVSGELAMFSIGGSALKVPIDEEGAA